MTNQFKYRIVGLVILITLGVIILPNILDGKKKYYKDQHVAIPLIPDKTVSHTDGLLPPVTSLLSEKNQQNNTSYDTELNPVLNGSNENEGIDPSLSDASRHDLETSTPSSRPLAENNFPSAESTEKVSESQKTIETVPVGEAWIIQLGAFNNIDKVNKLIAILTMANYQVYTIPTIPVSGKVTRIFIGPNISKQKLEQDLTELKELTGLTGIVKKYNVTR